MIGEVIAVWVFLNIAIYASLIYENTDDLVSAIRWSTSVMGFIFFVMGFGAVLYYTGGSMEALADFCAVILLMGILIIHIGWLFFPEFMHKAAEDKKEKEGATGYRPSLTSFFLSVLPTTIVCLRVLGVI